MRLPETVNRPLKIRGLALHSFRDPGKEGRDWAIRAAGENNLPATGAVTVLGFGLGYHLKGLAGLKIGGTVIEPDMELFAAALEHLDLTDVLENFRVLVGISPERLRRAHGDTLDRTILPHPPALRLHPDTLGTLAEIWRRTQGRQVRRSENSPGQSGKRRFAADCALLRLCPAGIGASRHHLCQ